MVRLWGWGTRRQEHPGLREAFDKVSLPQSLQCGIMTWEWDGGTGEHTPRWPGRLIDDSLSAWWEVCGRVTAGSFPGSIPLLVFFYQLLGLKVCLSPFQLPPSGEGLLSSSEDRTWRQWNPQTAAVDVDIRKWNVIRRKGSFNLLRPMEKAIRLPWETGDLDRKLGKVVWWFSSISKANMNLWSDEDI